MCPFLAVIIYIEEKYISEQRNATQRRKNEIRGKIDYGRLSIEINGLPVNGWGM